ncbi:MAG: RNA-directed DNA polymerase [Salinivirgaceae bacterium]|nr:RNA-directed DNA polymerase [Salinivirgaceae bacterium]
MKSVPKDLVADWLLKIGYFPESNVLPPSFESSNLSLQDKPFNRDISSLARRELATISYPRSLLSSRVFASQHPWNYHDIVFYLHQHWDAVLDKLFNEDLRIYSYSMPIPVTKRDDRHLSNLRAGRMIYEWVRMAENDLVLDATYYKCIAKTDITNFYASVYTHSIAWALEGRDNAFQDRQCSLVGNKIDKLIQYANDARTNGIPVGSALSDLIAEIVLSDVDARVSNALRDLDFVAVRFKDDYRVLCQSEEDAQKFLRTLSFELGKVNLILNEKKTTISDLPDGLYRAHDREYFPHSLRERESISFKAFEHTLLIALDIHRKYPGTSILEKFLSELLTAGNRLKIRFAKQREIKSRQIKKLFSLIFLAKRESEKLLGNALAIIELVYLDNVRAFDELKPYLSSIIKTELRRSSEKASAFEVVWLIFFSRYLGLGITGFEDLVKNETINDNLYVKSMLFSKNKLFAEANINLFVAPSECRGERLVDRLDVFKKNA